MSRKDHIFPKYVKLDIDPNTLPPDLYERGSKICTRCGTHWPAFSIFTPTPCCDASTNNSHDAPDMTWATAVKKLHARRFERYYEKWNDDVTDEDILFEDSIELPMFAFDEEDLRKGMEEIDQITGEQRIND